VTEQIALIEEVTRDGHDTTEARKLLRNYETTLEAWREHPRL